MHGAALDHLEQLAVRPFHQRHLDQRMIQAEGFQRRRDQCGDGLRRRADPQASDPPAREVAGPHRQRLGLLHQAGGAWKHLLAFGRQHQPLAHPVEQGEADLVLQRLQLPRQGRLADVQRLRGARDIHQLGDGDEESELANVPHLASLCSVCI
jgi:hypothetical protein